MRSIDSSTDAFTTLADVFIITTFASGIGYGTNEGAYAFAITGGSRSMR